MKTRDLENVSRIWQLAHLRHYFGQQRAMSSVHDPKLELIVNHHRENQDGIPDSNPAPLSNPRPAGRVRPQAANSNLSDIS